MKVFKGEGNEISSDPLSFLTNQLNYFQILKVTALVIGMVNFQTQISGPTIMNLEGILYNTVRDMNFIFLFPSISVSFLSLSNSFSRDFLNVFPSNTVL